MPKLSHISLFVILIPALSLFLPGSTARPDDFVYRVIAGAVEDNSWMKARGGGELKSLFALYYTEPMLSELVDATWPFIESPTDWYCVARVEDIRISRHDSSTIMAGAEIEVKDVCTGEEQRGRGFFVLKKTPEGWRISRATYEWVQRDDATEVGAACEK